MIDYFISATVDRIISLDSDTLFFSFPQELADWLSSGQELVRYNYELNAGTQLQNRQGEYFIAEEDEFPFPLVEGINGGFVCCLREMADFDLLERYLAYLQATIGVGRGQHVLAQNAFGLYIRNANRRHLPFPEEDYKVLCHYSAIGQKARFQEPAVFKHYNDRIQRFEPLCHYVEDIRQVVDQLTAG